MWITRNKFDKFETDSLVLWLDDDKPSRIENETYKYWFGGCGIELMPYTKKWYEKYKYLTWENEPVEVELSLKCLKFENDSDIQFGCNDCLHKECIKQLNNNQKVTCVHYRERISSVSDNELDDIAEDGIHEKYYYTQDTKGVEDFVNGFKAGYRTAEKINNC